MLICNRQPGECSSRGNPSCVSRLEGEVGRNLRAIACQLGPRSSEMADRWVRACLADQSRNETDPVAVPVWVRRQEVESTFRALATGDFGELVADLLRRGAALSDRGRPLLSVMACSSILAEVCLDAVLEEPSARIDALTAQACLSRFGQARASLIVCGFMNAEAARNRAQPEPGRAPTRATASFHGLVGASPIMLRMHDRIRLAARGREPVLIVGETGTGKELVARAIHAVAGDRDSKFIAVNCAAIPRDLVESELFGHRRGTFTDARRDREGLFQAASGGTLFLDEITELEPAAQAKLLRAVQEKAVRVVGDARETPVDVRVVAATNRSLSEALAQGRMRRDLYWRLQRMVLEVPRLNDRTQDIPLLAEHFVHRWRHAYGHVGPKDLTDACLQTLMATRWPGNVRQLENAVFAACLASSGERVRAEDVRASWVEAERASTQVVPSSEPPVSLRDAEFAAISEALRQTRGNKSLASRLLGISRKQLYVKIRCYGL